MNGLATLPLFAALAGAGASPAIDIASDSACPSADMVHASLDALGRAPPSVRATVTVRSRDERLRVEFVWAGHSATDVRELPAPAGCGARAEAAAVVLAAWLGIRPGAPVTAPPAPAAVVSAPAVERSAPGSPEAARQSWLGLGLGAAIGGGVSPGARLELVRARRSGSGLGWMVAVESALPRSRMVGEGTSSWIRPALTVAARASWRTGRVVLSGDLGPVGALAIAWGRGYPSNLSDRGFAVGAAAGLRLEIADGSTRPWIELRAIEWFGPQRLRFDAPPLDPMTADLPAREGFLTVGWSLPLL
jgi:hypothetical protein